MYSSVFGTTSSKNVFPSIEVSPSMVSSKVTSPPFQKCFPHNTSQSYHWKLPIRELCNFQLMDTLSLPQSCFSIFSLIKRTYRGFLFLFFRAQVFGSIQRFFFFCLYCFEMIRNHLKYL